MGRLAVFAVMLAGCGRLGFDAGAISSSDGNGRLTLGDYVLPDQFADGTYVGAAYDDGIGLSGEDFEGTFVSRVFELPPGVGRWSTFRWSPEAPYGKPLRDSAQPETGYPSGNVDMTDNIVLLHLDEEAAAISAGDTLVDSSGRGNDFHVVASGTASTGIPSRSAAGVFSHSWQKDKDVFGQITTNADLNFGTSDFTFAVWAEPRFCSPANTTFWGNQETDGAPHIWMGCGPNGVLDTFGGFYRGATNGSPAIGGFAGDNVILDNLWHYVAVVKTSPSAGAVKYQFYFDGVAGAAAQGTADSNVVYANPPLFDFLAFDLAAFPDSPAVGAFDEGAIWRRALTPDDIAGAWHRGALEVFLQVRFCDLADCSDVPAFVGPDGTSQSTFTDSAAYDGPPPEIPLDTIPTRTRRYAQYQIGMGAFKFGETPRIHSVEWTVE